MICNLPSLAFVSLWLLMNIFCFPKYILSQRSDVIRGYLVFIHHQTIFLTNVTIYPVIYTLCRVTWWYHCSRHVAWQAKEEVHLLSHYSFDWRCQYGGWSNVGGVKKNHIPNYKLLFREHQPVENERGVCKITYTSPCDK